MQYAKRSVRDTNLEGKRVLLRCDFNVPMKEGKIQDDTRIRAALPTIGYILDRGASLILCSHLGRPKGQVKPELTLAPVAERLSALLNQPVPLAPDCVGPQVQAMAEALKPGECLFLDDNLKNVKAAEALGIHAVQFVSYEEQHPAVMEMLAKQTK